MSIMPGITWQLTLTAVEVSIQSTKASEVMYLESENAYSFHIWPNGSCIAGIVAWLNAKYPGCNYCWSFYRASRNSPSKNRCIVPA